MCSPTSTTKKPVTPAHPRFSVGTNGLRFPARLSTEEADRLQTALDSIAWAADLLEINPVEFLRYHIDDPAEQLRERSQNSWLCEWSHRDGIEYDNPEQLARVQARVEKYIGHDVEPEPEFPEELPGDHVSIRMEEQADGSATLLADLGDDVRNRVTEAHIREGGTLDDPFEVMLKGAIYRELDGFESCHNGLEVES